MLPLHVLRRKSHYSLLLTHGLPQLPRHLDLHVVVGGGKVAGIAEPGDTQRRAQEGEATDLQ